MPRVDKGDQPSWYTFPLLTRWRDKLAAHLGSAGIETRPIVAGNMARQPMTGPEPGRFPQADRVFRGGLWMSVHPALSGDDLALIARTLRSFPWE